MHGGTLNAFSPGLGQGSTFTLRLTAEKEAPAAPIEPEATDNAGSNVVLVVDDNRDAADTCSEVLRLLGHRVESVYSGADAIKLARSYRANVVLLDIAMPNMDGIETLRRLRAQSGWANVYAVAMTGFGSEKDRAHLLQSGFDAHLTKPADLDALLSVLSAASQLVERQG